MRLSHEGFGNHLDVIGRWDVHYPDLNGGLLFANLCFPLAKVCHFGFGIGFGEGSLRHCLDHSPDVIGNVLQLGVQHFDALAVGNQLGLIWNCPFNGTLYASRIAKLFKQHFNHAGFNGIGP